jgi:ribosome biogenesis GTPase / thiamine phosphate phosphatase
LTLPRTNRKISPAYVEDIMPELRLLGFHRFFEDQLTRWPVPPLLPARVAGAQRGRFQLWSATGTLHGRLTGSLRRRLADEAFPGVGDWVVADVPDGPGDAALIRGVLDRRSVFTRGAAGREARPQVVAANVDRVFVVVGLDAGANPRALDRYLARIWAGGAEPLVLLNKADLASDPDASVAEVERRCPGVEVLAISALRSDGLDRIRAAIPSGCTAALVGASGAGKSTLANALLGEARQATAEVLPEGGRGRHTTTRRELLLMPGGGLLLDTPGMRELEVVDEEGLDTVFDDVATLAAHCRFRDCSHGSEPGCAVLAAVASGQLDPDRLESYQKLQREARAYELRHDVRARRQAERVWGQLSDEGALIRKLKGGK